MTVYARRESCEHVHGLSHAVPICWLNILWFPMLIKITEFKRELK